MKLMNKYKKLALDSVLFTIGGFASKILIILLVPLYTSVLKTSEYGIVDLISTTINMLTPILTLSISDATLRFAFDQKTEKSEVLCNSLLVIFISILVLISVVVLAKYSVSKEVFKYIIFALLIYIVNVLHQCLSNFIKAIGKIKLFTIQAVMQTVVMVVVSLIFLLIYNYGIDGYFLGYIIAPIISIVFMIKYANLFKYFTRITINIPLLKNMIAYSLPLIPTILAWWINTSADKYMILAMISVDANGLYGVAHKIPTILTTIAHFFSSAWVLSAIENRNEADQDYFFSQVFRWFNTICILSCTIIICCSKYLAKIMFAKTFFDAWTIVPMLVIASFFSIQAGFLSAAFTADKNTKELFKSTSVGAGVNILLNYFFIRLWGISGAAFTTAISFFVIFMIRMLNIKNSLTLNYNKQKTFLTYGLLFVLALLYLNNINLFVILGIVLIIVFIQIEGIKEVVDIVQELLSGHDRSLS